MKDIIASLKSAQEHLGKATSIINSIEVGNPVAITTAKELTLAQEMLEKKIVDILLLLRSVCAELTPTPLTTAMPKSCAINDFCRKMSVKLGDRNVYFFERNAGFLETELCLYSTKEGFVKSDPLAIAVRYWPRNEIISFIEATASRIKSEATQRKTEVSNSALLVAMESVRSMLKN